MPRFLMLGALLFAGSTAFAPGPGGSSEPDSGGASRERGRSLADLYCTRCHAIAGENSSQSKGPPFYLIRMRYSRDALVAEMQAIGHRGHFGMQPLVLSPSEIDDIAAYIDTVR